MEMLRCSIHKQPKLAIIKVSLFNAANCNTCVIAMQVYYIGVKTSINCNWPILLAMHMMSHSLNSYIWHDIAIGNVYTYFKRSYHFTSNGMTLEKIQLNSHSHVYNTYNS